MSPVEKANVDSHMKNQYPNVQILAATYVIANIVILESRVTIICLLYVFPARIGYLPMIIAKACQLLGTLVIQMSD